MKLGASLSILQFVQSSEETSSVVSWNAFFPSSGPMNSKRYNFQAHLSPLGRGLAHAGNGGDAARGGTPRAVRPTHQDYGDDGRVRLS